MDVRSDSLFSDHRARNVAHSTLLLAAMFGLFAAFGWVLDGLRGVLWLGVLGIVSATIGARVSPRMVLRMYRARPLSRQAAPWLFDTVADLARDAGLPRNPALFYVPSQMINAFAVGSREESAIGLTDGLLHTLDTRDVRCVLAHEITHLSNNDIWVMSLADFVTRTVNTFAWIGQIMLFINLPAVLTGQLIFPWSYILLMIFAPTLSSLLQLALSRAREHDADLGAAVLTRDPRGLARALVKMERVQGGFFERVLMPGRRVPEPSLLRTHPSTEERVERLLAMERDLQREGEPTAQAVPFAARLPAPHPTPPRWHISSGSWH